MLEQILKSNNSLQPDTFAGLKGNSSWPNKKMAVPKYELKLAFIVKQWACHGQVIILM